MKKISIRKVLVILSSSAVLCMALILSLFKAYSWYVDRGNFYADSNAMTTLKEGYCNHVEWKYKKTQSLTASTYTTGSPTLSTTIVPGDLVYYGFIFDLEAKDCLSALSIELKFEFSYSGDDFLSNCTIEANAIKVVLGTRSGSGPYTYTPSSTTTFLSTTNTKVASMGSDFTSTLSIPKVKNSDDKTSVYFMVYVPVWYHDTLVNQNSEMGSSLSLEKVVLSY